MLKNIISAHLQDAQWTDTANLNSVHPSIASVHPESPSRV